MVKQKKQKIISSINVQDDNQYNYRQPFNRNNLVTNYTSISEIFKHEIDFVKLCGGFQFEGSKKLAHLYRISLILLTKYVAFTYYVSVPKIINNFSKSSKQNITIYIRVYQLLSYISFLGILYTTIKYNNFFLLILKKPLDLRYVTKVNSKHNINQKKKKKTNKVEYSNFINKAKISIIINIILTALSARIRNSFNMPLKGFGEDELNKFYDLNISTGPISDYFRRQTTSTKWNKNSFKQLKWFLFAIHQTSQNSIIISLDVIQSCLHSCQLYGHQYLTLIILATLTDMILYSRKFDQLYHRNHRLSSISKNNASSKVKLNDDLLSSSKYFKPIAYVKEKFIIKLKNIISNDFDLFKTDNNARIEYNNGKIEKSLLTVKLLIQTRQILIVLMHIISLEYFLVYIFNVAKLVALFGLFYGHMKWKYDSKALALIIYEYFAVLFGMWLLRFGYHWLHINLESLKRFVDEFRIIRENDDDYYRIHLTENNKNHKTEEAKSDYVQLKQQRQDNDHSRRFTVVDESHRIVIFRLIEEITNKLPTDWIKLNIGSMFKHQLYLLTIIVSWEQLVEAGMEK